MLLSHDHKFIFIRCQKSASTSLELFFGKYCNNPNDIVTTLTPTTFSEEIYNHNKKGLTHKMNGMRDHAEWHEIRRKFGLDIFKEYFKFCFIRNPFEKAVSYYWERAFDRNFDLWCMRGEDSQGENSQYYLNGEKIMVDYVGKVESLKEDVKTIMNKLGLSGKIDLPKIRNGYRNRKIHYSYYYDDVTKARIKNLFRKQIKLFGYKFENGPKPKDKIIVNSLYSLSGYIFALIVKKITSLLVNENEEPKQGYLNILYSKNPQKLQQKYPDYKIISLIPTLIQDYYDIIYLSIQEAPNNDLGKIVLPEITDLLNISENKNILYIDSFHIQRNPKSIFYKIADFLNIPIINIDELSDFYKTNDDTLRRTFFKFLTEKQPLVKEGLSAEKVLEIYNHLKPKTRAFT